MLVPTDPTNLVRQASLTADEYMIKGKAAIDQLFGDGYAAKHPELVAAFMKTAAADFHTALLVAALEQGVERLAAAMRNAEPDE